MHSSKVNFIQRNCRLFIHALEGIKEELTQSRILLYFIQAPISLIPFQNIVKMKICLTVQLISLLQEKGSPKIYRALFISSVWSHSLVEGDTWLFVQHQCERLFHICFAVDLRVDEVVATLLNYEVPVVVLLHKSVAVL